MLKRLQTRHNVTLDDEVIDDILVSTGGHPGLLRETYHTARQQKSLGTLAHNLHVQDECQRIWLSLAPEEQEVMNSLANEPTPQPQQANVVEQLRRKGLVGGPWADNQHIFSSLLKKYIGQQHPVAGTRIHVDHERHTVWVNSREIGGLTRLEFKLMAYLEKKRNQLCTRDELAQHLYPDDMTLQGEGVTDTRLDSLVKRLRKRIEPDPKEPQYITTVRGHGLRLMDGDQADE